MCFAKFDRPTFETVAFFDFSVGGVGVCTLIKPLTSGTAGTVLPVVFVGRLFLF